ncbi:MAG: hypothetical protein Q4G47_04420, partial [Lachnospiraceae bacterium]|nr:hypothetical protein [Lachnospiraceae bacterium]
VVMIFTAMICGGGGVALIASGIPGIVIGVIIAAVAIVAGEDKVDSLIKDSKAFPRFAVREGSVASDKNRRKIAECIKDAFLTDEHLRADLIEQISTAIDSALGDAADNIEKAMNA